MGLPGRRAGGQAGRPLHGELVGEAPFTCCGASAAPSPPRGGENHTQRGAHLSASDKIARCLHSSSGKSGPSGHLGFVLTHVKHPHGPSFSVAYKSLKIGGKKTQDVNNRIEKMEGGTPTSSKSPEEKCNSTTTGQSASHSFPVHKPDPAARPQLDPRG